MCNMFKLVSKFLRHLHTQMGFRTVCQVQRYRVSGGRAWELGNPCAQRYPKKMGTGSHWELAA